MDTITIDRSSVSSFEPGQHAWVALMIRAARTFGLAEGVEEVTQLERLRAEACSDGPGYLFSRPLPAAEIGARLLDHRVESVPS